MGPIPCGNLHMGWSLFQLYFNKIELLNWTYNYLIPPVLAVFGTFPTESRQKRVFYWHWIGVTKNATEHRTYVSPKRVRKLSSLAGCHGGRFCAVDCLICRDSQIKTAGVQGNTKHVWAADFAIKKPVWLCNYSFVKRPYASIFTVLAAKWNPGGQLRMRN